MKAFYIWLLISLIMAILTGIACYVLMRRNTALLDNEKDNKSDTDYNSGAHSNARFILRMALIALVIGFLALTLVSAITRWHMTH